MQRDLRLPPHYRVADILGFHGRDTSALAERVNGEGFAKGFMLNGVPIRIDVRFTRTLARCQIALDGERAAALPDLTVASSARSDAAGPDGARSDAAGPDGARSDAARAHSAHANVALSAHGMPELERALRNVLALSLDPVPFVERMAQDHHFGVLVQARPGLRIVQTATVFEALTWAIIGQQINLPFAVSLRRTLIEQAGRGHSSGIACYPEALDVARLNVEQLTSRKFSRSKAETLLRVARLVADGELSLDPSQPIEQVSSALLAIKGVGPWTVNYTLMRGFGYADCSLHGDVAVRTALQRVMQLAERPDIVATERLLASYQPHRALAAAHLWASLSNEQ